MTERRPLLLAHRGRWRDAPENSLEALVDGCRAPGLDGVEFDVRIAADGTPVVIHDEDLLRVQRIPRRVADLGAEALARYGIPTLATVLAALPRAAYLDIELKEPPDLTTVEVIAAGRGPELARAVVSSFDPAALRRLRDLAPSWSRWLNAEEADEGTVRQALELGCDGLAVRWESIDEDVARRVAQAGLEPAAWTVRRRETVDWLGSLGVVAICVEGPAAGG